MRLLLDQGLGRTAGACLRELGHDAVHVGDIGMAEASDRAIVERARSESRVVVTLDADFHTIIALARERGPSVIRLRVERLRSEEQARLIQRILSRCEEALLQGAFVTSDGESVRVRRLPV